MSRPPSPATEIRTLKRELKAATADAAEYRLQARFAEGRLTKAQQEVAEWKRRFDTLLANIPASQPVQVIGQPFDLTPKTIPPITDPTCGAPAPSTRTS